MPELLSKEHTILGMFAAVRHLLGRRSHGVGGMQ